MNIEGVSEIGRFAPPEWRYNCAAGELSPHPRRHMNAASLEASAGAVVDGDEVAAIVATTMWRAIARAADADSEVVVDSTVRRWRSRSRICVKSASHCRWRRRGRQHRRGGRTRRRGFRGLGVAGAARRVDGAVAKP